MTIHIHNLRNSDKPQGLNITVKCDRSSPYGNPFKMDGSLDSRETVCDSYHEYFHTFIKTDPAFIKNINKLVEKAKTAEKAGMQLYLACWCAPKRCHCETIKDYIENRIDNDEET